MKYLKTLRLALAAILVTGAAGVAHAQLSAGGPPGWNAAMSKLFGDIKAFSAKAEMRALDKSGQPAIQVPMNFALLDNKVRMDIDMTQVHLSKPDAKQFDAPGRLHQTRRDAAIDDGHRAKPKPKGWQGIKLWRYALGSPWTRHAEA